MIITRECSANYLIPENENDARILRELYESILATTSRCSDNGCIEKVDDKNFGISLCIKSD